MHETIKHPIWLEVAELISARVSNEGHGFLIEHDELHKMLKIKDDAEVMTRDEHKKINFEIFTKTCFLRDTLLFDHQIYLSNVHGKGYLVMTPDDQVSSGFKAIWARVIRNIKKSFNVLTFVDEDKLTYEARKTRDRNLNKAVFVMQAASKRKIPTNKKKELNHA